MSVGIRSGIEKAQKGGRGHVSSLYVAMSIILTDALSSKIMLLHTDPPAPRIAIPRTARARRDADGARRTLATCMRANQHWLSLNFSHLHAPPYLLDQYISCAGAYSYAPSRAPPERYASNSSSLYVRGMS